MTMNIYLDGVLVAQSTPTAEQVGEVARVDAVCGYTTATLDITEVWNEEYQYWYSGAITPNSIWRKYWENITFGTNAGYSFLAYEWIYDSVGLNYRYPARQLGPALFHEAVRLTEANGGSDGSYTFQLNTYYHAETHKLLRDPSTGLLIGASNLLRDD